MKKHKLIFLAPILFITFGVARTTFSQWERMNIKNGAAAFVGIGTNTSSPIIFAENYFAGVIRSTDNGENWTLASSDLENLNVDALTVIGANTSAPLLLAGTYLGSGEIFRSTDSGASWIKADSGLPKGVIIADFAEAGTASSPLIFVSTAYGNAAGVFLSTDNGISWKAMNTGLTVSIGTLVSASSNASAPRLFAEGTASGIFRSTDNGGNWANESNGIPSGSLFSLAALDTNTASPLIFVGTWGAGVFRSMDEGTSWEKENNGLTDLTVYSVASYKTNLFAGTDSGIFLSTDSGASWRSVSYGLSPNNSFGYIGVVGSTLFAQSDSIIDMFGDATAFAWRRPLSEIFGTNAVEFATPAEQTISAYPNPASASVTLHYSLDGESTVSITIYDALGRVVARPVLGEMESAGAHEALFDTNSLPPGLYSCRLQLAGGAEMVAKMVVMR
ncbi:MAG TPA: T9SS type A sorting domain-containing protein [Candidatus Kapabacteria bacterium]|nr:T9SS type A sorting domain-containing protein [Candidatus Kapabacteria bacterium]